MVAWLARAIALNVYPLIVYGVLTVLASCGISHVCVCIEFVDLTQYTLRFENSITCVLTVFVRPEVTLCG